MEVIYTMKLLTLALSLLILFTVNPASAEQPKCNIDLDNFIAVIGEQLELTRPLFDKSETWYLTCEGIKIADCSTSLDLDLILPVDVQGEPILAPDGFPITCAPVIDNII